jgi:hypothetical protein
MTQTQPCSTGALWARFRFSVIGSLLSSPPEHGSLQRTVRSLAEKTWSHPVTGRDVRFAAGTIACWYYTALRQPDDPIGALCRAVCKTAARPRCRRPSPSDSIFNTAITRTGAINCTTTTSPRF